MTNATNPTTNAQGLTLNALNYRKGDARDSMNFFGYDPAMLAHCCNNAPKGVWGAGFVIAINGFWTQPEQAYHDWAKGAHTGAAYESGAYALGEAQLVEVEQNFYVANVIGQVLEFSKEPNIRYEALEAGLVKACAWMQEKHGVVNLQAPRLGAGLAGGEWGLIEAILLRLVTRFKATIVIVDLPGQPTRPTRK